jgi:uncharacterized protein
MGTYLARHAERSIVEALADTRVVIVNGARQSGKSTLVHHLMRNVAQAEERTLDSKTDLAAARLDPDAFVRTSGTLVIDEIQRAPELVTSIKAVVDRDNRPGQFVLTGSARLLGQQMLPDSLVGRSETIELWPLSQAEIAGTGDDRDTSPIDQLFSGDLENMHAGNTGRSEYFDQLARGGYPEAIRRDERRRSRFFDSYINDLLDRDISQLNEIGRRDTLGRLLTLTAGTAGQLIVPARLSNDLRIDAKTIERYLRLFEEVFLIKRIPAWSNSMTARATQTRKLLVVDSGLAAHLCGRSAARLAKGDAATGPLLENFVLTELARLLPYAQLSASLFHFRTKDGIEVDGVLESRDGSIVGVEVKASESVRAEDLAGLRYLRDRASNAFVAGVVFYAGRVIRSLGDRCWAVPIDALWNG